MCRRFPIPSESVEGVQEMEGSGGSSRKEKEEGRREEKDTHSLTQKPAELSLSFLPFFRWEERRTHRPHRGMK